MADKSINATAAATADPFLPSEMVMAVGTMRNFNGAGVATHDNASGFLCYHDKDYGNVITVRAVLGANLDGDLIQLVAMVRSGANALCTVGVHVIGTTVQFKSETAAEVLTSNGTATLGAAPVLGDDFLMTYTKSTGAITLTLNGTPITSSGDADDDTYGAEATLAACFGMFAANFGTARLSLLEFNGVVVTDVTAPVLTSPISSANGSRAANGGVTTDDNTGTLYAVLTTSATKPTAVQVEAGQNNAGTAAVYANGGLAITTSGAKTVAAPSGLTPKTAYYWHFMHKDSPAGNRSLVATSAALTTHGEITDTDGDNVVTQGQTSVVLNGFFGPSDPVVRIKSGSVSQQQVDNAHTSTTITLASIVRGNLPYTDATHTHTIEVDTDE